MNPRRQRQCEKCYSRDIEIEFSGDVHPVKDGMEILLDDLKMEERLNAERDVNRRLEMCISARQQIDAGVQSGALVPLPIGEDKKVRYRNLLGQIIDEDDLVKFYCGKSGS